MALSTNGERERGQDSEKRWIFNGERWRKRWHQSLGAAFLKDPASDRFYSWYFLQNQNCRILTPKKTAKNCKIRMCEIYDYVHCHFERKVFAGVALTHRVCQHLHFEHFTILVDIISER